MPDEIPLGEIDTFSPNHKRASWYTLQLLASLPGLLFLLGYLIPAIFSLSIFLIFLFGDPFLRRLVTRYKLVRSIIFSTISVYLGTALLHEYIPILALPFLIASACLLVICFGRKAKRFESAVLSI